MKNSGKTILVTGGAGYIGSHMVAALHAAGWHTVTLDNLSGGYRDAVLHGDFYEGDIADAALLGKIFSEHNIHAVMHFAAKIVVSESVAHPELYYRNNVLGSLHLLSAMRRHQVSRIIFSSTAAVYGMPQHSPIDETHVIAPINPYGHSKAMVETLLADFAGAYGLRYGCLRYFNAAGADPQGRLGERHDPETHLIPILLEVAAGRRPAIEIYGNDYPTHDGSCLRDYVHVTDLCDAHIRLLSHIDSVQAGAVFNLGTGRGFTVLEVVEAVKKITGRDIPCRFAPRRPGDAPELVADGSRAMQQLGWQPQHSDLETIIRDAWQWECRRKEAA